MNTQQYSAPTIPFELHPATYPEDWSERTLNLWNEICDELLDPDYTSQHYKRHTYDAGCRGPLCRKFVRDASRSRPRTTTSYAPREDRAYDPIIDYFRIVAVKKIDERRAQLIKEGLLT